MTFSFRATALTLFAVVPIALAVPASAQNSWRAGQAPDTPIRTTELPPSGAAPTSEIADRYLERARNDRENADLWVYCAAAALKRGTSGEADADAYARDVAGFVKPSIHRGAGSPCEDAIPARIWDGDAASAVADAGAEGPAIGTPPPVANRAAGGGFLVPPDDAVTAPAPGPGALTPAEEERLRRANVAADTQERARVAAQAAAEQRRADSQARYERERAQYEADVAASRAADAAYQRQLEERRRSLESGQYREPQ